MHPASFLFSFKAVQINNIWTDLSTGYKGRYILLKGRTDQFEFGILGLILGAYAGVLIKVDLLSAAIGAVAGAALFGLLIGSYAGRQSERRKLQIIFGTEGLFVGALIGGSGLLKLGAAGMAAGAAAGAAVFGLLVGSIIGKQKQKGRYLSFRGEVLLISLFGLAGTWTGLRISGLIIKGSIPLPVPGSWGGAIYDVLVPLMCSLILSVPLGFIVAANRFRPFIGGLLALAGGLLVLWVGINIAPILFLPGSGLYWAGLVFGLLICVTAVIAIAYPQMHIVLGAATIAFSILSFVGAAGGLILGGIFGILGGTLTVAWNGLHAITAVKLLPGSMLPTGEAAMGKEFSADVKVSRDL